MSNETQNPGVNGQGSRAPEAGQSNAFGQRAPQPNGGQAPPPRDGEQRQSSVVIRRYTDNEIFDVHKQGLIDGVMEIASEPYIEFQVWLEKELTANKHEVAALNAEIAALKEKIAKNDEADRQLHEQLHLKQAERDALVHVIQELQGKRQKLEEEKTQIEENVANYTPSAAWPSIVLLLIAAAAFVAGEIVVNVKIVADAFNIKGLQGYVFAVGLAAVSVLLKPAYDRLIEKPYLESRPRVSRIFITVMGMVSILAITTAYLLGEFRFDTEALVKITGGGELMAKVDKNIIQKIENELTLESVTGNIPKFSFILAAILFAIGGTVCLSIALTALEYRDRRRRLEKRLTGVQGEIAEKINEAKTHIESKNKTEAEAKTLAHKIAKLPKSDALESRLQDLQSEHLKKVWEAAQYEWEGAAALYRNAYERGKAIKEYHRENPDVWHNFYSPKREAGRPTDSDDGFISIETVENVQTETGETKKIKRRTPVRPYQALKLAIGAKFRNDCQTQGIFDPNVKNYDVEI